MLDPDAIRSLGEAEKLSFLDRLLEAENWDMEHDAVLAVLAEDQSADVRRRAIGLIRDCPALVHAPLLMSAAANDPAEDVRVEAVASLAAYVYRATITCDLDAAQYAVIRDFLIRMAGDASAPMRVRAEAVQSLAYDDAEEICKLVEWAYRHEDSCLRLGAMCAMGRGAIERWTPYILSELYARDRRMRVQAIRAASEACVEDATPMLRNLALASDREVRVEAIEALPYTCGPGALETLELCAGDEDAEVRDAAQKAIEVLRAYKDAEADFSELPGEEEAEDEDEPTDE